jgi:hypothetical protein
MEEPRTRDDLLHKVRYGELTPDQAEAMAIRFDLGKLSCEPNDGTFDPMGETWWTLTMAVAWIAWRTPKLVRVYLPAFRSECWDWHYRDWRTDPDGADYSGHFLEQRRAANLCILHLNETHDSVQALKPAGSISVRRAQDKLWDALGAGLAEGYGTDIGTGERAANRGARCKPLSSGIATCCALLRTRQRAASAMTRSSSDGRRSWRYGRRIAARIGTKHCRSPSLRTVPATCRFIAQRNGSQQKEEAQSLIHAIRRFGIALTPDYLLG